MSLPGGLAVGLCRCSMLLFLIGYRLWNVFPIVKGRVCLELEEQIADIDYELKDIGQIR